MSEPATISLNEYIRRQTEQFRKEKELEYRKGNLVYEVNVLGQKGVLTKEQVNELQREILEQKSEQNVKAYEKVIENIKQEVAKIEKIEKEQKITEGQKRDFTKEDAEKFLQGLSEAGKKVYEQTNFIIQNIPQIAKGLVSAPAQFLHEKAQETQNPVLKGLYGFGKGVYLTVASPILIPASVGIKTIETGSITKGFTETGKEIVEGFVDLGKRLWALDPEAIGEAAGFAATIFLPKAKSSMKLKGVTKVERTDTLIGIRKETTRVVEITEAGAKDLKVTEYIPKRQTLEIIKPFEPVKEVTLEVGPKTFRKEIKIDYGFVKYEKEVLIKPGQIFAKVELTFRQPQKQVLFEAKLENIKTFDRYELRANIFKEQKEIFFNKREQFITDPIQKQAQTFRQQLIPQQKILGPKIPQQEILRPLKVERTVRYEPVFSKEIKFGLGIRPGILFRNIEKQAIQPKIPDEPPKPPGERTFERFDIKIDIDTPLPPAFKIKTPLPPKEKPKPEGRTTSIMPPEIRIPEPKLFLPRYPFRSSTPEGPILKEFRIKKSLLPKFDVKFKKSLIGIEFPKLATKRTKRLFGFEIR